MILAPTSSSCWFRTSSQGLVVPSDNTSWNPSTSSFTTLRSSLNISICPLIDSINADFCSTFVRSWKSINACFNRPIDSVPSYTVSGIVAIGSCPPLGSSTITCLNPVNSSVVILKSNPSSCSAPLIPASSSFSVPSLMMNCRFPASSATALKLPSSPSNSLARPLTRFDSPSGVSMDALLNTS